LVFALNPIFNKFVLQHISIKGVIIVTSFIYFAFVLFYLFFVGHNNLMDEIHVLHKKKQVLLLLLISVFMTFIVANYMYFSVIQNNKTYLGVAIISSYPLITAIAGYILFNESLSRIHVLGILSIVLGISLLAFQ
jgi:drug/metabolite transporter (DMT)-like permease